MKTEHSELMAEIPLPTDSLEVKLAFQTIACRTCEFFWPANGSAQPYGPYSTFDLGQNFPPESNPPAGNPTTFSWNILILTRGLLNLIYCPKGVSLLLLMERLV